MLDQVIVFDEWDLRRLLCDDVAYYSTERVHSQLRDAPAGRPTETRPAPDARVGELPRLGGLHHRNVWQEVV
jgi:hypothetical protein